MPDVKVLEGAEIITLILSMKSQLAKSVLSSKNSEAVFGKRGADLSSNSKKVQDIVKRTDTRLEGAAAVPVGGDVPGPRSSDGGEEGLQDTWQPQAQNRDVAGRWEQKPRMAEGSSSDELTSGYGGLMCGSRKQSEAWTGENRADLEAMKEQAALKPGGVDETSKQRRWGQEPPEGEGRTRGQGAGGSGCGAGRGSKAPVHQWGNEDTKEKRGELADAGGAGTQDEDEEMNPGKGAFFSGEESSTT